MLRSYLSPSLCSCAICLVIILLRIPVGIIATIPITLLAIALLGIILSIVGLLAITTCSKHSSLLIHNYITIHETCTKGRSWGKKNYQMIQHTAWFQASTAMWTRSALFWSKTLFITIKCMSHFAMPCQVEWTVTVKHKTLYGESTHHVSWCYCKTICKTVHVSTNTQGCPSYPICSYGQEQEYTVSTQERPRTGVYCLNTGEDNSCEIQHWQTKRSAVFVDIRSFILLTTPSLWMSPAHVHTSTDVPHIVNH